MVPFKQRLLGWRSIGSRAPIHIEILSVRSMGKMIISQ